MFHLIHNLQNKPESARRRFAFAVSLVATIIIVGVWLTTLPSRTSSERRARVENTAVTPLGSLSESFSGLFSGIPEQFQNLGDALKEGVPSADTNTTDTPPTVVGTGTDPMANGTPETLESTSTEPVAEEIIKEAE